MDGPTSPPDHPAGEDVEAIPPHLLHILLDQLLHSATPAGKLQPDVFWNFVAGLAQGRGITSALHSAGLEAIEPETETRPGLREAQNERRRRSYHVRLLRQLLADIGALRGPSVLPGDFNAGAVISDLGAMLEGPTGGGSGEPQILRTRGSGPTTIVRRQAQKAIVHAVYWQARFEFSRMCFDLSPDGSFPRMIVADTYRKYGLDKKEWDRWVSACGGATGALVRHAMTEGEAGTNEPLFLTNDEYREKVIALARERQRGEKDL